MKFESPEEVNDAFGELNVEQMRVLVKMFKHVRGRCRNNTALRNWLIKIFPKFSFSEVYKEWNGEKYKALEISERGSMKSGAG